MAEMPEKPVEFNPDGTPKEPVTRSQLFRECTILRQALTEEHEKRLQAATEAQRLLEAGRWILLCLGGASDDTEGGWDREEINRLFENACKRWPELDPRRV